MPTIAVLGTFDSKGPEHAFIAEALRRGGFGTLLIDVGSLDAPTLTPDIPRAEILAALNAPDTAAILARRDRGECVTLMARAAAACVKALHLADRIHGIISLGGGGGTAIATAAMRALPIGFPKLMVSTLASGQTAPYVGTTDITMMPAIVDVSGLNRVSRAIFTNAAGAIAGMVTAHTAFLSASSDHSPGAHSSPDRPLIVASMFGNTTACVTEAKRLVEAAGYEVLVFAATGNGGRAMESLILSGLVAGVLDITTTEWADELVGGVLTAGPTRLDATAQAKIPAIVAPGCLDMVNFGVPASVPAQFAGRTFYPHNPQVTLMRTTPAECTELGRILAEKINRYTAPVTVLIPRRALSLISAPGQPFHSPAADDALFTSLRTHLRPDIPVIEHDVEINDPVFARACAAALLAHLTPPP
ncbi:MAG: Tm-1-like ATP-binding domain-containing protein [Verrucomicrobia bacterium]|nr:Tm-1-like ATP-binding domain-containing protein [Verrucomicrobiota bacterium]